MEVLQLICFCDRSGPDTYRGPNVGSPFVTIPSVDPSAPIIPKPSKFLMRLYSSKSPQSFIPDVSVLTSIGEAEVPFIDFRDTNSFRKVTLHIPDNLSQQCLF